MARSFAHHQNEGPGLFAVLKVLAVLMAILVGVSVFIYSGYLSYTTLDGPDTETPALDTKADPSGRSFEYGRSRLSRQGKLWVLELVGNSQELGAAHGRLTRRLLARLDARIDFLVQQRFGEWLDAWASRMLLRWDYRDADQALSEDTRLELAAFAGEIEHAEDAKLSAYHRSFLRQCFFEVSRRVQDAFVDGSMFAVTADRNEPGGEAGNLLVGRSFTIDLGADFEADRVVAIYRRDGKYPFASVTWPGMIGVVTGVNARGIVVTGNPARTDDPREESGEPLPIVLRRVLEEADTLDRAITILRDADLRTGAVVLVGDGVQRKSVVVEMGPRSTEESRVVRGEGDRMIWATDHLVSENFNRDAQNERVARTTASGYRYERLAEILESQDDWTPETVLRVLRDRRGHKDAALGLGNRYALETLATTHSVVIDATAMVLWVAEGPSTLGRYRAFDLRHLLRPREYRPGAPQDFPPDRLLYSEEYNDYRVALDELEYARKRFSMGDTETARFSAEIALSLAPDVGPLHRLLGNIYRELDMKDEALTAYRRYLELVPGQNRDQDRVRGIIDELEG